ncbi:hypothetical protein EYF80_068062 [Liparis tanakae]|uniref:Uncharacterized protein n=1 Tax=Liparis tanakae TaxID=230148 RepID=A0A4Z2DZ79_9TELE|nr:hypothetical protein EYF80_068062 [Liparis tanakae]
MKEFHLHQHQTEREQRGRSLSSEGEEPQISGAETVAHARRSASGRRLNETIGPDGFARRSRRRLRGRGRHCSRGAELM